MSAAATTSWAHVPGFLRAPNIANDPAVYEIENMAADPDRTVEAAIRRLAPWDGKVVLDIGAGTGHHVTRFDDTAAHVVALEPDATLRPQLMRNIADRGLNRVSVIGTSAADIPLRDKSVDLVHARFAYFFGPGCEPGLREVERVLAPGGTACIVDNDLRSGTFARWVREGYDITEKRIDAIEQFWLNQGFTIERLASRWAFQRRNDFERVIRLEFPAQYAERLIASNTGLDVDYNLLFLHRTYP